jgi:imidazolonepropionase-like amidohydrolase
MYDYPENLQPGPRFLANGKEIAPRDGALIPGITAFANGPDETRQVIREHILTTGVDVIKLSMSGEEITENLRAEDTTFDDESVAAAVEEAHSLGVRVCAHARSDESVMQCLMYGVDVVSSSCGCLLCGRGRYGGGVSIYLIFCGATDLSR